VGLGIRGGFRDQGAELGRFRCTVCKVCKLTQLLSSGHFDPK